MHFARSPRPRKPSWFRRLLAPALAMGLASMVTALASSCGSTSTGTPPCDSVYAGKCGGFCANDFACADGLYCGNSATCTADCAPGAAGCPTGQTCNVKGRCIPTGGEGGSGGGGGIDFVTSNTGTGSGADACADVNVNFEKQIPTVMLLIDQSGSMTASFGNGDRWNVLYDTLMDPNDGIVKKLEKDVRFGLALYTSNGGNAGGTCPMLAKVPLALNNHAAIDAVYAPQDPAGDTPTGESITAVTADLVAYQEPGPKIIVLATDGEPDTCAEPNPQNGQDESIAAAQASFGKDVRTFVISVGAEVSLGHLQDLANAGAGLPIGGAEKATYYQALNPQTLIDAFDKIINGVRSCVLKLNGIVDETAAAEGQVSLDGKALPYNDMNGWRLNGPDEIELLGTACDTIKQGDHSISVQFPCGIVIPK
ncbi:vWA domain-containing protein [Polyangium jinanense]|uniref:VWA domain-containing protein n=1 Tax=Polyangium jinanense TaxID=2829994 RepID=A0A9X4ANZ9_9BACT|nr:vWA domain-containing protein [Polyangium jinanense]MDC3953376.1 VWA domain-containing protein [Polyangium jinanense]MDC3979504.1 VWA domain-containing protein [Polyangium jinanense]